MTFSLLSINLIIIYFFKRISILIIILISVAFLTLLERKILSLIGSRKGPNKVTLMGLLQPIADALKLINKQLNCTSIRSYWFYYLRRRIMFLLSLILWSTINISSFIILKLNILVIMLILSLNSIKIILAGWRTFTKYPLLGIIRTINQTISYESVLCLCLLIIILIPGSFNFLFNTFLPLRINRLLSPFTFLIWIPALLADLNRTPYDFRERERELVRGYNTEFGSRGFTLIFLAEYRNIIFIRRITTILFFWSRIIMIIIFFSFFNFFIIWIRSTLPRRRMDKLIITAWKFFIPFLTIILIINSLI